jgi:hypothetical protein
VQSIGEMDGGVWVGRVGRGGYGTGVGDPVGEGHGGEGQGDGCGRE